MSLGLDDEQTEAKPEIAADQPQLFDAPPAWKELWADMPEFEQEDKRPFDSIKVYFADEDDRTRFFELVGISPHRTRGIWYPPRSRRQYDTERTVELPVGRYPIYVISKGRADTRLTSRALERLGLPYHIVVEPQELDAYAAHIDSEKILTLPFSERGQGSIPARNWVWEHATESGVDRHWILDDNLRNFARLNQNENRIIVNENPFIPCEDFVDRYENVALAGMEYRGFASDKVAWAPFKLNTRIYSCILIDNAIPFRWRGRYNEDTDLSLRALKAGYCTVLFRAYLIDKVATMTMTGGNADELYVGDGRLKMAESLQEQHPDVVSITEKWGRPQHQVDYSPFRFNALKSVEAEEQPPPREDDLTPQEQGLLAFLRHHHRKARQRGTLEWASREYLESCVTQMPGVESRDELRAAAQGLARKRLVFYQERQGSTLWMPAESEKAMEAA